MSELELQVKSLKITAGNTIVVNHPKEWSLHQINNLRDEASALSRRYSATFIIAPRDVGFTSIEGIEKTWIGYAESLEKQMAELKQENLALREKLRMEV